MYMTVLLKPIKTGIRSKLFICGVVLIAGWSYWYISTPLIKLLAIFLFIVTIEIMLWQWINFFGDTIIQNMKFTFKKSDVSWNSRYITPQYSKLAERIGVKLNKKRPFGVIKGLNNAYSNSLKNQVMLGEDLLKNLDKKQRLALVAHELTHLKQNHGSRFTIFSIIIAMLASISLSFSTGPAIISNLMIFATLIIAFVFISWKNEFDADKGAAYYVNRESTISLLRNISPRSGWNEESETHPSINSRVSKLKRL